jgi:hypothetical protein
MTEHALAQEQIASYLADGLDAAERGDFEAHMAACPECARSLEEARAVDARLNALFIGERPRAGLEDRMIRGLRAPDVLEMPVRRSMSLLGWSAVGAAATVMVGVLGAGMVFVIEAAELGELHMAADIRDERHVDAANVRTYAREASVLYDRSESMGTPDPLTIQSVRPLNGVPDSGTVMLGGLSSQSYSGTVRLQTADERAKEARESTLAPLAASGGRVRLSIKNEEMGDKEAGGTTYDTRLGKAGGRVDPSNMRTPIMPPAAEGVFNEGRDLGKKQDLSFARRVAPTETSKTTTALPPVLTSPASSAPPPPPAEPTAPAVNGTVVPGKDKAFDPFRAHADGGKGKEKGDVGDKKEGKEDKKPVEALPEAKPAPKAEEPAEPKKEPEPAPVAAIRKIIRTGEIEFEVDSFDTSVERITKIAGEEKGFIAIINSQKLENGKVRGSVVVRCPPEKLDTLLLKLRALGDLKTQRIGSRDVGKEFTDTESELKGLRGMEQRFLDIIKNGKGEIKDLIQAEKQLGEYRLKIERLEGELRYLNNQVSLSTLTIVLTEREIRAAAGITESSTMSLGLEVEDVEKSQQQAHASIMEAKGRILRSELKQNGPGMFEAVIKFQVPPEQVAGLREKLVKLGTITRQDVGRKYAAEGGSERVGNLKVTREDAVFVLSLLNSANFAPRERVEVQLACVDAEAVYRSVIDRANKAGARIVSQAFDRQPNEQSQGTIRFEVKTAEADAVVADLKALGEVMRLQVVENVDPANAQAETTSRAKRGFVVLLQGMGTTTPRETATIQAASRDVPASFKSLRDAAAKAKARILNATLNEQDRQNVSAQLDVEIRRADEADLSAALTAAGDIISRTIQRAADNQPNVIDSKVQWRITLINQVNLKPREVWTLAVEVPNVDKIASEFTADVLAAKGRTIDSSIDHQRNGQVTARLVFDVPFDQAATLADKFRAAGTVRLQQAVRNPQVPEGSLSIARIDVTLSNALLLVPSDQGLGLTMHKAMSYGTTALLYVLMFLVMGLIVVVPVIGVGLGLRWAVLKLRGPGTPPVAPSPPATA